MRVLRRFSPVLDGRVSVCARLVGMRCDFVDFKWKRDSILLCAILHTLSTCIRSIEVLRVFGCVYVCVLARHNSYYLFCLIARTVMIFVFCFSIFLFFLLLFSSFFRRISLWFLLFPFVFDSFSVHNFNFSFRIRLQWKNAKQQSNTSDCMLTAMNCVYEIDWTRATIKSNPSRIFSTENFQLSNSFELLIELDEHTRKCNWNFVTTIFWLFACLEKKKLFISIDGMSSVFMKWHSILMRDRQIWIVRTALDRLNGRGTRRIAWNLFSRLCEGTK